MPQKKCKQCKRIYTVGIDGLGHGLCDTCAQVVRDQYGHCWLPGQYQQVDDEPIVNGKVTLITRDEAFGRAK